jgi:lipopolysaccharide export system permease protein
MRGARTLSRYILWEVIQYTLIGLGAISVVLVTRNVVQMLDRLVGSGFVLSDLLWVFRLFGTMLAVYTLPISLLFGVLLAVGRLAEDIEITAMRSCGVGVRQIVMPIATLGILISLFTGYLSVTVEPAARREMKAAAATMLMRGAIIEPGKFTSLRDRLLYVDERDSDGGLHGVVISDRSHDEYPLMIFAETAEISLEEASGVLTLKLDNGSIHMEAPDDPDGLYQRIAFSQFTYEIDVTGVLKPNAAPRARAMTVRELRETIARIESGDLSNLREKHPVSYEMKLHERFAMPLAPLLFTLVGAPLGMRRFRGARSWGVMLCAGIAFVYYMMQTFCESLAINGWLSGAVAMWIPNLVFIVLAAWLLARTRAPGN